MGLNYSIWNASVILSWKKKTIKPNMIDFLDFKRRSIETVPTLLITVKIITNTPQPLLSGHLYTAISIRWPNKIKLKMVAFLLFSFLLSLVLICRRHTWDIAAGMASDTVTAYVNIHRRIIIWVQLRKQVSGCWLAIVGDENSLCERKNGSKVLKWHDSIHIYKWNL